MSTDRVTALTPNQQLAADILMGRITASQAVVLSQTRYEQIIADGVRDSKDFYIGAIGCIGAVLLKPDCTVEEIRKIVAAMHTARDAWIAQRAVQP